MTQCHTGSVILGHYATGQALRKAGVVSASDMTLVRPCVKGVNIMGSR